MKYILCSLSYGEYLENMVVGLIDKFISFLNTYAYKGNYSYYFHVSWQEAGYLNLNRVYTIEVYDNTSIEQITSCINRAYAYFFAPLNFNNEWNTLNIKLTIEEASWNKFNKTYLKVIKIHDSYIYLITKKL